MNKNPHAVALGKKAKNVPKRITPERATQLRTQLIKARAVASLTRAARGNAELEELEAAQLCAVRWWQDTPKEDAPEFRADALRIAMVLSKVIDSERGHSSNDKLSHTAPTTT